MAWNGSTSRTLRGHAGRKLIEVDALGHEKRMISVDKPRVGNDVYLTVDFRLQKLAEDLLGEEAGAIVALDPQNGDILALASRPSFDPNALSRGLRAAAWNDILQDERHPLTNRAIQVSIHRVPRLKSLWRPLPLKPTRSDSPRRFGAGDGFDSAPNVSRLEEAWAWCGRPPCGHCSIV